MGEAVKKRWSITKKQVSDMEITAENLREINATLNQMLCETEEKLSKLGREMRWIERHPVKYFCRYVLAKAGIGDSECLIGEQDGKEENSRSETDQS